MRESRQPLYKNSQQGAALLVGLIFLLLMTMIGLAAMQATNLQEKMAGNLRDRGVAMFAGESALRDAEGVLKGLPMTQSFGGTNGLYSIEKTTTAAPDPIPDSNWTASGIPTATQIDKVPQKPQYWIEKQPNTDDGVSVEAATVKDFEVYKVTTRASGGTTASVVVLQSSYLK